MLAKGSKSWEGSFTVNVSKGEGESDRNKINSGNDG